MHFLDAINKSENKVAARKGSDGRVMRRMIDFAIIQDRNKEFREARIEEVEGFNDWAPEEIKNGK